MGVRRIAYGRGALLFLDNLGVLSLRTAWNYWPLLLAAGGVYKLAFPKMRGDAIYASALIVFGVALTLIETGAVRVHFRNSSWTLSLLLILAGTRTLQMALERNRHPIAQMTACGPGGLGEVDNWIVAGNLKRRFDDVAFRGGAINCLMGEVMLDLRRALASPEGMMIVEAHCLFGASRFRVPSDWTVKTQGASFFGGFEDKTVGARLREGEAAPCSWASEYFRLGTQKNSNEKQSSALLISF